MWNPRRPLKWRFCPIFFAFFSLSIVADWAFSADWITHAPLPEPLANNAITTHSFGDTCYVYSFMGIDTTKAWSGITRHAWRLNTTTDTWQALPDVPGSVGRIAALAFSFGSKVYLFGGYSVASDQSETTWGAVDIYDPATNTWSSGSPIPVPVDDMVGGVWRDSLIYLVSGWSQTTVVSNTQVYDPAMDTWAQATPFPIGGTFGGAGGIVGNWFIYVDGVRGNFLMRENVHRGLIDPNDPLSVTWAVSGKHPGESLYRMASGNVPGDTTSLLFAGGSDNAYNFDGIGFNGQPSEPTGQMWYYFPSTNKRRQVADKETPTMDHRGFPTCGDRMYIAGGMIGGQQVTDLVQSYFSDDPTGVAFDSPVLGEGLVGGAAWELRSAPNPARTRASFSANAGRERTVLRNARVYDLRGRLVRSFNDAALAESSGFEWDLRDNRGKRVAAGIYMLKGSVFDRNISRKITVVN